MNKGILYMILAGLSFMVVNFFVKLLGTGTSHEWFGEFQKYPAHELVLARSIVSFAISLFIIKRRKLPVFGNNKKWLIIRGLSGMIALTIFFYTLHNLPLALASVLMYLAPIFTVILALFILKERVLKVQWFFIVLAFLGVGIISYDNLMGKDALANFSFLWIGLSIIAAALAGLAYASIVRLKETDTPINIVLYFPMLSIPFMVIWCLFDFVMPSGIEWLLLLIIGVFTQIAQILLTKAFHFGPTAVIAPLQYLGAIYAFLIGYFVFHETLSLAVNIGIAFILIGVVANSVLRNKKKVV